MKKLSLLFIISLFSFSLKAEHADYYITFIMETIDGQKLKGYYQILELDFNPDSINNVNYTTHTLIKDSEKQEDFHYFRDMIKYEYVLTNDAFPEKQAIYYLTSKASIPTISIKSIVVEEIIRQEYDSYISSNLQIEDTNWLKTDPVKKMSFHGDLNDFDIFIHTDSKRVDHILNELEIKQKEIDLQETESRDILPLEGIDDDEFWKLIEKLEKEEKVVVIRTLFF